MWSVYLNYTQLTLLLWFVYQQEETDDLFRVCTFHIHTQSGAEAHATTIFLCDFAFFLFFFVSFSCTTLLIFLVCAVQLGEIRSHQIISL